MSTFYLLLLLAVPISRTVPARNPGETGKKLPQLREWKIELFQWKTKSRKEAKAFWNNWEEKIPTRADQVAAITVFRHDTDRIRSLVTVGQTTCFVEIIPEEDRNLGPITAISLRCRGGDPAVAKSWLMKRSTEWINKKFEGQREYSRIIGSAGWATGELKEGQFESAIFRAIKVTVKVCDEQAIRKLKASLEGPSPPERPR
jgi:hypothetical protein